MFGWEFPPHIAGGLGTACLGLTRGLAKQGVEVLFVMPKASGDEDQSAAKIINASDVESLYQYHDVEEYWKNIDFMEVGSNLMPYMDPETFTREVNKSGCCYDCRATTVRCDPCSRLVDLCCGYRC